MRPESDEELQGLLERVSRRDYEFRRADASSRIHEDLFCVATSSLHLALAWVAATVGPEPSPLGWVGIGTLVLVGVVGITTFAVSAISARMSVETLVPVPPRILVRSRLDTTGKNIVRRVVVGGDDVGEAWEETVPLPVDDGDLAAVARHRVEDDEITRELGLGRLHDAPLLALSVARRAELEAVLGWEREGETAPAKGLRLSA